jgi:hypothetical protein
MLCSRMNINWDLFTFLTAELWFPKSLHVPITSFLSFCFYVPLPPHSQPSFTPHSYYLTLISQVASHSNCLLPCHSVFMPRSHTIINWALSPFSLPVSYFPNSLTSQLSSFLSFSFYIPLLHNYQPTFRIARLLFPKSIHVLMVLFVILLLCLDPAQFSTELYSPFLLPDSYFLSLFTSTCSKFLFYFILFSHVFTSLGWVDILSTLHVRH